MIINLLMKNVLKNHEEIDWFRLARQQLYVAS